MIDNILLSNDVERVERWYDDLVFQQVFKLLYTMLAAVKKNLAE